MINQAFLFALRVHDGQLRKDGIPYIAHPVEVAMELARSGAGEELICAGFLHDVIEDAHVTREQLQEAFTPKVTRLVCKDSEDKSKSWEERKTKALQELERSSDRDYKMLMCADKLSNLRSIKKGHDEIGEEVWKRFKRGKDSQAWMYRGFVRALSALGGLQMYEELKQLTAEVFQEEKEAVL